MTGPDRLLETQFGSEPGEHRGLGLTRIACPSPRPGAPALSLRRAPEGGAQLGRDDGEVAHDTNLRDPTIYGAPQAAYRGRVKQIGPGREKTVCPAASRASRPLAA